jgi:hypothetical protein
MDRLFNLSAPDHDPTPDLERPVASFLRIRVLRTSCRVRPRVTLRSPAERVSGVCARVEERASALVVIAGARLRAVRSWPPAVASTSCVYADQRERAVARNDIEVEPVAVKDRVAQRVSLIMGDLNLMVVRIGKVVSSLWR